MGAERVNQIEYDVSDNIKVNLSTGRLLFTYNIINLFKDEYNLNYNGQVLKCRLTTQC